MTIRVKKAIKPLIPKKEFNKEIIKPDIKTIVSVFMNLDFIFKNFIAL